MPYEIDLGDGIKLVVEKEFDNKVIGRKELYGYLIHFGRGTPPRYEVRKKVAAALKVPLECVYVENIMTEFGWGRSRIEIRIYYDPKRGEEIEELHIKLRNLPPEERQKKLAELRKK